MSDAERSLYDDVTKYLLEPSLYAFSGRQPRLLLIGFHRRMASSIPVLAASLENVAARLRQLQSGLSSDDTVFNVLRDLEDEDEIDETSEESAPPIDGLLNLSDAIINAWRQQLGHDREGAEEDGLKP